MGLFDTPPQTSTQTSTNWLRPQWESWLDQMNTTIGNTNYQPYSGQTVAPFSPTQNTALGMQQAFTMNGTPASNAASGAITQQAGGVMNPFAGQANQFMGLDNPELQNMINSSNADIVKNFQFGTQAPLDAAMTRSGAYGGSAYNEMQGNLGSELAKRLADNTSGLRYQAYRDSAGLNENQINRQTNAFDTMGNRQLQAAGLGIGSQAADQSAINNLFQMGGAQQANSQAVLDAMREYYSAQQQAPFLGLDQMGNAFSRAQGASNTMTSTTGGGKGSDVANIIGLILAGTGLLSH